MIKFEIIEERSYHLIDLMRKKHPNMGKGYTIIPTIWSDGDFSIECRHAFDKKNGDMLVCSYYFHSCEAMRNNDIDEIEYQEKTYLKSQLISYDELKKIKEKTDR